MYIGHEIKVSIQDVCTLDMKLKCPCRMYIEAEMKVTMHDVHWT